MWTTVISTTAAMCTAVRWRRSPTILEDLWPGSTSRMGFGPPRSSRRPTSFALVGRSGLAIALDPADAEAYSARARGEFATDSPLEQMGFELSVPLARIRLIFAEEKGLQVDQSGQNRPSVFTGDQRFESRLLQRRVGRTRIAFARLCTLLRQVKALLRRSAQTSAPRRSHPLPALHAELSRRHELLAQRGSTSLMKPSGIGC